MDWLRCRVLLGRACLVLPLFLLACGGGGGWTPAPTLPVLDLGLVASTVPSRTVLSIANPLSSEATITAGATTGPFTLDPADLPAQVVQGESADIGVLYAPEEAGPATGTVVTVFDGDGGHVEQTWAVRATGETVTWALTPPTLDFGGVEVGDSKNLVATFQNTSTVSPVTFTTADLPYGGFSILGSPFPLAVPPGATRSVTLSYAPITGGIHDGTLALGPNDSGGPASFAVLAAGLGEGSEDVTDHGTVYFDGNDRTPTLSVSVPDDAISLYLEGVAPRSFLTPVIGLATLYGPGGKEYENTGATGDYTWNRGWRIFSAQVPNTDRTGVQLVPGGGTYTFSLKLMQGLASSIHVRTIVERRAPGNESLGTLPLNVYVADGITPTAATAPTDSYLQAVLTRVDTILSQQGIRVGDIDYYDITDPDYDDVTSENEFYDLLETSSQATELRLNLFFVKTALGGNVVGVSAAVTGPRLNGTELSGVMSVYGGGWGPSFVGLVAAHEIGHFIGLYHTKEQTGEFDFIDDTEECTSGGCDLLMHWQASPTGTDLTNGQGLVIRGHPHVDPPIPGSLLVTKPTILSTITLAELQRAGEDWCATCNRAHKSSER